MSLPGRDQRLIKKYGIDETNKFNFIMAGDETRIPLDKFIELEAPFPNEPPFMKRRTKPAALRFHKFHISISILNVFCIVNSEMRRKFI